ncbi:hypothetical protein F3J22_10085 [Chitinophaga sp. Cy-1792]|nr:DUF5908 family protein [Chitinophaga sp. Cy-1792]NIG53827.1 hypothetical protein [Chitinophaga sp. Cy-1792]
MPIQIRELHIKVEVNAGESPPGSTPAAAASPSAAAGDKQDTDKDLIISECVEQVMQVLRDKMEK